LAVSAFEQEGIVLNAVWAMIDGMANYGLMDLLGDTAEKQAMFHTSSDAQLFNVLLVDFLSKPETSGAASLPFDLPKPPADASASNRTYLFYLRQICAHACLGNDPAELAHHVEAFGTWLEGSSTVPEVWLADIELQADITITRFDYLRICGDIAKHNFSRLSRNVEKIRRILAANGHTIDDNQGYLALPSFYEWFHRDLFLYHASDIVRQLNNIRWAIYRYLLPPFHAAYKATNDAGGYTFSVPEELTDTLAKSMWWDLMNRVRAKPWQLEFTVSASLQKR